MRSFFQNKNIVPLICALALLVGIPIGINTYHNQEESNSAFAPNGAADENSNFYKPSVDSDDEAVRLIQQASENYFFREFDKAAENYRQAIAIYSARKDIHQIARTYESLGDLYQFAQKVVDAESSYLKAVSFHSQNHDVVGEGRSLKLIGDLYMDLKRFELAGQWYLKAELAIKNAQSHKELAKVYESIGRYYWDRENLSQAMESFLKSQEIFIAIKDQSGYDHITKVISIVKKRKKD